MAIATTNSVFQTGVGTILYSDASCTGNESNILDCNLSIRENECNHFQEAGVDCRGRQMCTCGWAGGWRGWLGIEKE